ncbi:MAG TPA: PEP-CTERM sorting domain-containing protein [Bryobacteraceae bacterium]|nr:PEP-CTERM sorting domain-containing protein [Bryobacteraceae bacterium]
MKLLVLAAFAAALAGQAHATCIANTGVVSITDPAPPPGTFQYLVLNGCNSYDQPLLDDFFLPYFADAGISNIVVPGGWSYTIEASNDLFGLPDAGVIEFAPTSPVGYFTEDFSYTADYSSGVDAPYVMDLTLDGSPYQVTGDPLIPASPDAVAALGSAVPEPSLAVLLALGCVSMWLALRRRRLVKTSR